MSNPHTKQYRNRLGVTQWMPSTKLVERLIASNEGFCLACTHEQPNVEPDAVRLKCESCGEYRIYGAERLVLMNLTFEVILH